MKKFYSCILFISFFVGFSNNESSTKKSISFTENKGQVSDQNYKPRPDVLFSGNANGMVCHLKTDGISYQLCRVDGWKEKTSSLNVKGVDKNKLQVPDKATIYRIDVGWVNCNSNISIKTDKLINGFDNYYLAVCPNGIDNVKSYSGITYKNLFSGIDLHYYDSKGELEYDYLVAAGADYQQIKMEIKGAETIRISKAGELIIKTPLGDIVEKPPVVKQGEKLLMSKWKIDENIISFEIKNINPLLSFIIDPTIAVREWGTYYGGPGSEGMPPTVTTDNSGNVFMFGATESQTNIATSGGHQTIIGSTTWSDAYVVKLNSNGVRQWATYYGGEYNEDVGGCATDQLGNFYFAGQTSSSLAIASPGSFKTIPTGIEAFLVKLNSNGIRQWGTYYGGANFDGGTGCSTDASGNVYLLGNTESTSSISTTGAHQTFFGGSSGFELNAFLVKFNSNGIRQWGTYYGGFSNDQAFACSTDPSGNIYFTGWTTLNSGTQIATAGSHQSIMGGGGLDAFVVKFNSNGVRQWGTYYGGTAGEAGWACSTDRKGNVYLGGHASYGTGTAVATTSAHQPNHGGGSLNGFLVKFNSNGIRKWGTYYGGMTQNDIQGCTTDSIGNVYACGMAYSNQSTDATNSWTIIATPLSHQPIGGDTLYNGDAYLVKFDSSGVRQWGTYYGGFKAEAPARGNSCCTDKFGNVYLSGITGSDTVNVISTSGSHQFTFGGMADSFLVKFSNCVPAGPGCVGINEMQNENVFIKIYPNPTSEIVNILSDSKIKSIKLFSIEGKLVLETSINKNTATLNVSGLSQGIYFLSCISEEGKRNFKIIKE